MNKMALPQRLFRLGGMRAQEHQYLSKAKEEKFPKETEVWSARQEEKKMRLMWESQKPNPKSISMGKAWSAMWSQVTLVRPILMNKTKTIQDACLRN